LEDACLEELADWVTRECLKELSEAGAVVVSVGSQSGERMRIVWGFQWSLYTVDCLAAAGFER